MNSDSRVEPTPGRGEIRLGVDSCAAVCSGLPLRAMAHAMPAFEPASWLTRHAELPTVNTRGLRTGSLRSAGQLRFLV
jgi:hypothetical protein